MNEGRADYRSVPAADEPLGSWHHRLRVWLKAFAIDFIPLSRWVLLTVFAVAAVANVGSAAIDISEGRAMAAAWSGAGAGAMLVSFIYVVTMPSMLRRWSALEAENQKAQAEQTMRLVIAEIIRRHPELQSLNIQMERMQ